MDKKVFSNIDGYIAAQAATHQPLLKKLNETIRKAAPVAEEVISYNMPAYKFHGILVYFAAHEKHIGFYAMKSTMSVFRDRITKYQSGEATLRFALDKTIPVKLITEIVQFRAKENMDKKLMKEAAKVKRSKK